MKIDKADVVAAVKAFEVALGSYLDTPDPISGFGLGLCPVPPRARAKLVDLMAGLIVAVDKIPASKKKGWRQ